MEISFIGFCYVCNKDSILRSEHEDWVFNCAGCRSIVKITDTGETRFKEVPVA